MIENRNIYVVHYVHGNEVKDQLVAAPNKARALNYVARTSYEVRALKAGEAIAMLKAGASCADCDDDPQAEMPLDDNLGAGTPGETHV